MRFESPKIKGYGTNSVSICVVFSIVFVFTASLYLARGCYQEFRYGFDDGNIYLAYARSLHEVGSFSFTRYSPAVEGFSSLLWLLMVYLAMSVSYSIEITLQMLCVLMCAIAVSSLYTSRSLREIISSFTIRDITVASAIWFLTPSFLAWSLLSIMESGLAFFFFTLCIVAIGIDDNRFERKAVFFISALLFLFSFLRPEGFIYSGLTAALYWEILRHNQSSTNRAHGRIFVLSALLGAFIITVFRHFVFDSLLPNTYYAKVGSNMSAQWGQGLSIFFRYLLTNPILILTLIYSLYLLRRSLHDTQLGLGRRLLFSTLAAHIISVSFFVILTGSDHFIGARFLKPIWISIFLALVICLTDVLKKYPKEQRGWILILLCALNFSADSYSLVTGSTSLLKEAQIAGYGRKSAEYLNRNLANIQLPEVASVAIGGFGFAYLGSTKDVLGLVDPEVAHSPGDRTGPPGHAAFNFHVFMDQAPQLFLVAECEVLENSLRLSRDQLMNAVLRDIDLKSNFRSNYTPFSFPIQNNLRMCGFVRSDFLNNLEKAPGISFLAWEPLDERGWEIPIQ